MTENFDDIIPRKETITFEEMRDLIYEIDKTWREILKEKEAEIKNLKYQLKVEKLYVQNELRRMQKEHEKFKRSLNEQWKEIQEIED
jgi:arsenate reductase-like glutaredoxin family protein